MSVVLATVALPPATLTAPPLTRRLPAVSRLTVMWLAKLSPATVRMPVPGANAAVTAGARRSASGSRSGRNLPCQGFLYFRTELEFARGRMFFQNLPNIVTAPIKNADSLKPNGSMPRGTGPTPDRLRKSQGIAGPAARISLAMRRQDTRLATHPRGVTAVFHPI